MLQGWDLNSRDTRDMKNNMEARTYPHTHIVLAKVLYEENRPAHLVLHTRDKQLKSAPHAGHQSMCCHREPSSHLRGRNPLSALKQARQAAHSVRDEAWGLYCLRYLHCTAIIPKLIRSRASCRGGR